LEADPSSLPSFFDLHFPGVTTLIPPAQLISSFTSNPHLPLITIKCTPYHFSSSGVILGDAAHAMVPFYGQGMNAGLEDVRILFYYLDQYCPVASASDPSDLPSPAHEKENRAKALAAYSLNRTTDAYAISELALHNYIEMRSSVVSPVYLARKWLEERLSVLVPSLGWATKYSRVSFGNERYSEVVRKSERQGRLLVIGLMGLATSPFVLAAVAAWWRWKRAHAVTRAAGKTQGWLIWGNIGK
jgi:kynurenine 3-monooxygenase